jgi:hypothetical protein
MRIRVEGKLKELIVENTHRGAQTYAVFDAAPYHPKVQVAVSQADALQLSEYKGQNIMVVWVDHLMTIEVIHG